MTAPLMAQQAYGAAARPLRTARGTEDELFAEATAALLRAELAAPVDAVHRNRRLRTTHGADVAPLVEINRAVMAGLRPPAAEAAA